MSQNFIKYSLAMLLCTLSFIELVQSSGFQNEIRLDLECYFLPQKSKSSSKDGFKTVYSTCFEKDSQEIIVRNAYEVLFKVSDGFDLIGLKSKWDVKVRIETSKQGDANSIIKSSMTSLNYLLETVKWRDQNQNPTSNKNVRFKYQDHGKLKPFVQFSDTSKSLKNAIVSIRFFEVNGKNRVVPDIWKQ